MSGDRTPKREAYPEQVLPTHTEEAQEKRKELFPQLKNEDDIQSGTKKTRENGDKTYLLIMPKKKKESDKKDKENTLYIELSTDGNCWTVNSGGIFREGYSRNKKTIWEKKKEEEI